jgi:hypothetical protein
MARHELTILSGTDDTNADEFTIFTDWTRKFESSCTTQVPPFSDTLLAVMVFLTPPISDSITTPIALMSTPITHRT